MLSIMQHRPGIPPPAVLTRRSGVTGWCSARCPTADGQVDVDAVPADLLFVNPGKKKVGQRGRSGTGSMATSLLAENDLARSGGRATQRSRCG